MTDGWDAPAAGESEDIASPPAPDDDLRAANDDLRRCNAGLRAQLRQAEAAVQGAAVAAAPLLSPRSQFGERSGSGSEEQRLRAALYDKERQVQELAAAAAAHARAGAQQECAECERRSTDEDEAGGAGEQPPAAAQTNLEVLQQRASDAEREAAEAKEAFATLNEELERRCAVEEKRAKVDSEQGEMLDKLLSQNDVLLQRNEALEQRLHEAEEAAEGAAATRATLAELQGLRKADAAAVDVFCHEAVDRAALRELDRKLRRADDAGDELRAGVAQRDAAIGSLRADLHVAQTRVETGEAALADLVACTGDVEESARDVCREKDARCATLQRLLAASEAARAELGARSHEVEEAAAELRAAHEEGRAAAAEQAAGLEGQLRAAQDDLAAAGVYHSAAAEHFAELCAGAGGLLPPASPTAGGRSALKRLLRLQEEYGAGPSGGADDAVLPREISVSSADSLAVSCAPRGVLEQHRALNDLLVRICRVAVAAAPAAEATHAGPALPAAATQLTAAGKALEEAQAALVEQLGDLEASQKRASDAERKAAEAKEAFATLNEELERRCAVEEKRAKVDSEQSEMLDKLLSQNDVLLQRNEALEARRAMEEQALLAEVADLEAEKLQLAKVIEGNNREVGDELRRVREQNEALSRRLTACPTPPTPSLPSFDWAAAGGGGGRSPLAGGTPGSAQSSTTQQLCTLFEQNATLREELGTEWVRWTAGKNAGGGGGGGGGDGSVRRQLSLAAAEGNGDDRSTASEPAAETAAETAASGRVFPFGKKRKESAAAAAAAPALEADTDGETCDDEAAVDDIELVIRDGEAAVARSKTHVVSVRDSADLGAVVASMQSVARGLVAGEGQHGSPSATLSASPSPTSAAACADAFHSFCDGSPGSSPGGRPRTAEAWAVGWVEAAGDRLVAACAEGSRLRAKLAAGEAAHARAMAELRFEHDEKWRDAERCIGELTEELERASAGAVAAASADNRMR